MATVARADAEKTYTLLSQHISSCAKTQVAVLVGVITLLLGMLGVLVNLYVLPHSVTITDTTIVHTQGK